MWWPMSTTYIQTIESPLQQGMLAHVLSEQAPEQIWRSQKSAHIHKLRTHRHHRTLKRLHAQVLSQPKRSFSVLTDDHEWKPFTCSS